MSAGLGALARAGAAERQNATRDVDDKKFSGHQSADGEDTGVAEDDAGQSSEAGGRRAFACHDGGGHASLACRSGGAAGKIGSHGDQGAQQVRGVALAYSARVAGTDRTADAQGTRPSSP